MMHLDQAEVGATNHASLVDVERLHKEGNWGIFHEVEV